MITGLISLLSLVTLVGGHFVNRRWDRAVLFFSLLGVWLILCGVLYTFNLPDDPQKLFETFSFYLRLMVIGTISLLVLSALVTVLDRRKSHFVPGAPFTLSGKIGASVMSVLCALAIGYLGVWYSSFSQSMSAYESAQADEEGASGEGRLYGSEFFSSLKFGTGRYPTNPRAIPEDDGYLLGQIQFDGEPAEGVALKLQLNDEFESEKLVTDENGYFSLKMPQGDWYITAIQADRWKGKPQGNFMLVSGIEPKLRGNRYSEYPVGDVDGYKVTVLDRKPAEPHIQLEIRREIELLRKVKQRKPVPLSLEEDKIEWQAHPDASQYHIKISRVTERGSSTVFSPISHRVVKDATSLALKDLQTRSIEATEGEEKATYSVDIRAFSDDGTFLSESSSFPRYVFNLKEPVVLVDEDYPGMADMDDTVDALEAQDKASKRFSAIELLIDEQLYTAAETLLQGDLPGATPGRKEALQGYLYASQKQCQKAREYFDKARDIGGASCVNQKYERLCQ